MKINSADSNHRINSESVARNEKEHPLPPCIFNLLENIEYSISQR
jgi:hypothetical protein